MKTNDKQVANNTQEIALLKQGFQYMKDWQSRMEKKMDDIADMVSKLPETIDGKYASKEEVNNIKTDIGSIKKIGWGFATAILLYVLNLFLGLVHIKL